MSLLLAITTATLLAAPADAPLASSDAPALPLFALSDPVGTSTVHTVAEPQAPQASRTVRVISQVLVAGAAGTLAGAVGGYLGCIGSLSSESSCSEATVAAGLVTGFGLAVAVMVPLTGSYFDAHGSPWVSWFGEALGAGTALAIGQGSASRLMWFGPPLMLAGAVLGYELSARSPGAASAPPALRSTGVEKVSVIPSFGPDGRAGLVVAGRW